MKTIISNIYIYLYIIYLYFIYSHYTFAFNIIISMLHDNTINIRIYNCTIYYYYDDYYRCGHIPCIQPLPYVYSPLLSLLLSHYYCHVCNSSLTSITTITTITTNNMSYQVHCTLPSLLPLQCCALKWTVRL